MEFEERSQPFYVGQFHGIYKFMTFVAKLFTVSSVGGQSAAGEMIQFASYFVILVSYFSSVAFASIVTVDDFPDTEKLNFETTYNTNYGIQHTVKVDSLAYNSSGLQGRRVGQFPNYCYDRFSCQFMDSRSKR
jgi:hypothetical protein